MALRAVFFDVGGTLLEVSPSVGSVYAEVLGRFGRKLHPGRLQDGFVGGWRRATRQRPPGQDRFSAEPGGSRGFWRRQLDHTLDEHGEPAIQDDEFDAVMAEFGRSARYRLFPEVDGVLAAVAGAGLELGVISNWDERLPGLLAGLGISERFSVTIVSGIERIEKPATELFALACERADVSPGEALHVGDDREADYDGARAAGLEALLVDRSGETEGDGVIPDLTGIIDRIG